MKSYDPLKADSIFAPATAPGSAGVAVVRLSGTGLLDRLTPLLGDVDFTPRKLRMIDIADDSGGVLDRGMGVYFPMPHSFTGEEVFEFHCHGSPPLLQALSARLIDVGFRPAEPGEFSRRAYLNGKMDLVQAEALMALIQAGSLRAARQAERQMAGALSRKVMEIRDRLFQGLVHLEAALDFPEEEIDTMGGGDILGTVQGGLEALQELLTGAVLGDRLREGVSLAFAGRANVGKSSLFNTLCQSDRAIVTSAPGTTRDVLEHGAEINGIPVNLVDLAGLRESDDPIEREGVRRAREVLGGADLVLMVLDVGEGFLDQDREILSRLEPGRTGLVWNKVDLVGGFEPPSFIGPAWLFQQVVSAKTGEGFGALTESIGQVLGEAPNESEGTVIMAARQRACLGVALNALKDVVDLLARQEPLELAAISYRDALGQLGDLVGQKTNNDLLDAIFRDFCIGK